jgi:hypothetical protein
MLQLLTILSLASLAFAFVPASRIANSKSQVLNMGFEKAIGA